ncbi:MAG: hypothetical protein VB913_04415, partial [Rhodospirillales bacterium]
NYLEMYPYPLPVLYFNQRPFCHSNPSFIVHSITMPLGNFNQEEDTIFNLGTTLKFKEAVL